MIRGTEEQRKEQREIVNGLLGRLEILPGPERQVIQAVADLVRNSNEGDDYASIVIPEVKGDWSDIVSALNLASMPMGPRDLASAVQDMTRLMLPGGSVYLLDDNLPHKIEYVPEGHYLNRVA